MVIQEVMHIIIKKDYAAALIEQLIKEEAIEIIYDEMPETPEWQKEALRNTLQSIQKNPESLEAWDEIKQKYWRS
jgi:hypothetical protein